MQGSKQQPCSLWPAQPSCSSSPDAPMLEATKDCDCGQKPAILPGYRLLLFTHLHMPHPHMKRQSQLQGLQSLVAVLLSCEFSDSPPPLKMVLEQHKYTHLAQEQQLSKSSLCSPGWSIQMLISASVILSGRRAGQYLGMVLTLTDLQQTQTHIYELHLPSLPGASSTEKL